MFPEVSSYPRQSPEAGSSLSDALRVPARRRALGLLLAFTLEALLVLVLLTLGRGKPESRPDQPALVTFDVTSPAAEPQAAAPAAEPEETTRPELPSPTPPAVQPITPPLPVTPAPDTPIKAPAPLVELPRETIAAADLGARPASPPSKRGRSGPPAPAGSGDTPLVASSGPNGERLFAAAWYREPYDNELRGYLSTAQGPGWALIACRTVADFRVDDCVGLDEYPDGSRIGRAVLAAAWQFRVRPPQIGGRSMVGEWVRIRIDYSDRPRG
jgi:protein TonB